MKKNIVVADGLKEVSQEFYGMNNSFDVQEFLLFITSFESLEIQGMNLPTKKLFGAHTELLPQEREFFYKNIIHSEDYTSFIEHLQECKGLAPNEEKEIVVRLKDRNGTWQKFCFRHRLYLGGENASFLGIATEVRETESAEEKSSRMNPVSVEELQRSKDQYQQLLNSLDEAFCSLEMIFDLNDEPIDYLFLETNPAFEKHLPIKNAEGKTSKEVIPGIEGSWIKIFGKIALTREPLRFQESMESLGNMWLDLYAFPIGDKQSRKVAVLFSDITARKNTEIQLKLLNEQLEEKVRQRTKQLEANSELLQIIFDTTNEGIKVLKPVMKNGELVDFRYIRVNQVIVDQYQDENMVGRSYLEINPSSKEIGVFDRLKKTMLTGEYQDFEILYDRDGYNDWFRITSRRKNKLLIVSMEDITRRKLEAQRLRETIRFKKHLTKASPDIIMIFNLYEENIKYINRDMGPVQGMRRKDILGLHLEEIFAFIHPRDREEVKEFHSNMLNASDRDIIEIKFRLRSGRGKYAWYNAMGKVFMRNKNANVSEYMILLRNVDHQIETQKALINAEKLSIKGEIARTLAHELRNPLASIGMASDILKKSINGGKQEESYLNIINRSTKVLNKLVTDLLTSSNYSPAVLEKNCLACILNDSLKLAGDRIYLTGIKVIKKYEKDYFISADGEKLKIALLNIIVNASEAMEPEEGILQLAIERIEDNFRLIVEDNGCGLEKEQLEKLFDAFYTQKADGVGVGLSSVKNILEEHDAEIEVFSEPNKGTTFQISFPCHENFERT